MSRESREFRPFVIDDRFVQALDGAVFSFGDRNCVPGGRVLVEDQSFGFRAPSLSWSPEDGFEDFKKDLDGGAVGMGLSAAQVCLIVTARSSYLKHSEVVFRSDLTELESLERVATLGTVPDGSRRQVFRGGTHNVVIDAFIALASDVDKSPLRPSHKGTWLARASFRIECESSASLFKPLPLSNAVRARLKLRPGTVHFVQFENCELTEPMSATERPILWVDEDLLTTLDNHRNSPAGIQLQKQLALDVIGAAIHEYARQTSDTRQPEAEELAHADYEDIRDSLIGRIARLIAGGSNSKSACEQALHMCREEPARAFAWAEDRVALGSSVRTTLEGTD